MTKIDCAFVNELTLELSKLLENKGYKISHKESIIYLNQNISEKELAQILKDLGKKNLDVIRAEFDTIIIAKKINLQHMGLASCSICGYIAFEEELVAHERAHGIHLA